MPKIALHIRLGCLEAIVRLIDYLLDNQDVGGSSTRLLARQEYIFDQDALIDEETVSEGYKGSQTRPDS